MKTRPNDQAFPLEHDVEAATNLRQVVAYGLTKRELFAAMAMQGMHASTPGCISEDVSFFAVRAADALIAELNKKER